jgi:hypothetical protein
MPDSHCPFIGSKGNPDQFSQQAGDENACYRHGNPQPVIPTHQGQFCLSDEFKECSIYQHQVSTVRGQPYLQPGNNARIPKSYSTLMLIFFGAGLLTFACMVLFMVFGGPARVLAGSNSPSSTPQGGDSLQASGSDDQTGQINSNIDLFASLLNVFITQTPTQTVVAPSDTPAIPSATLEASSPTASLTNIPAIIFETPTATMTPTATVYFLPTLPRPSRTPTSRPSSTTAVQPTPQNTPTNRPPTQVPPTQVPPTQPPPPTSPPVVQPSNTAPPPPTPVPPTQPPRPRPSVTSIVP